MTSARVVFDAETQRMADMVVTDLWFDLITAKEIVKK